MDIYSNIWVLNLIKKDRAPCSEPRASKCIGPALKMGLIFSRKNLTSKQTEPWS